MSHQKASLKRIAGTAASTLVAASLILGITGAPPAFAAPSSTSQSTNFTPGLNVTEFATIEGDLFEGETLTANPGTWNAAATFTYQWARDGVEITAATGQTYKLVAADFGKTISVVITASAPGYTSGTTDAQAVTTVGRHPVTSLTAPSINGEHILGQTLTANPGTWEPNTSFSYQWLRHGKFITGATAETYVITEADLGYALSLRVTAKLESRQDTHLFVDESGLVTQPEVQSDAIPAITGTLAVGSTLTAEEGIFTEGTSFGYQWSADFVAIPGATAKTFSPTAGQLGQYLTVEVTGTKLHHKPLNLTSDRFGPIVQGGSVANPVPPSITGTRVVGQTLQANPGTWAAGTTLRYEWLRAGSPIAGASAAAYTLTEQDFNQHIGLRVTGTISGYTPTTAVANAGVITRGPVVNTVLPTIQGHAFVGSAQSVNPGTWTAGTKFTYQWLRNGQPITGATAAQYTPVADDLRARLSVNVTGSLAGYTPTTVTTAQGVTIGQTAVIITEQPGITGKAVSGETLSATTGTFSGVGPQQYVPVFSFQWMRDGSAIAGATQATYQLTGEDVGARIFVQVTATAAGYPTNSQDSLPTEIVVAAPVVAPPVVEPPVVEPPVVAPPVVQPPVVVAPAPAASKADVIARDRSGRVFRYPSNGKGGFLARKTIGTGWNGFNAIVTPGDFNGDKLQDVITRDGAGKLWMYKGTRIGGVTGKTLIGTGWGSLTIVTPGDFNRDGNADLIARASNGVLYLYPGNGKGGFKSRMKIGTGWNGFTILGTSDFNGDRKADLIARDSKGRLFLYAGNGIGKFAGKTQIGTGWNGFTLMAPGDFNGDRKADLLARDRAGKLWLYKGNGSGTFAGKTQVGTGWQVFTLLVP